MVTPSHIIATTSLLLVAYRANIPLSPAIIIWSCMLGNCIDLDHIVLYPRRCSRAVLEIFNKGRVKASGKYFIHSYIQEPWFVVIVLIVSVYIYSYTKNIGVFLPGISLAIHVAMDAIMWSENCLLWPFSRKRFRGFIQGNTLFEYIFSTIGAVIVLYIAFKVGLLDFLFCSDGLLTKLWQILTLSCYM